MGFLLELGALLALVGVPLACSTWLADAVLLPKQAVFTVAATLVVGAWLAGWRCGRWPLLRRGAWVGLAGAPWLWSLVGTLAAGWPREGEGDAGLAVGLALVGLAFTATLDDARERRWLGYVGVTAALLAAYSWLQRLGLDPVAWSFPHLSQERTIATLGNPDFLALYLVVAAPLALERILEWRGAARLLGGLGWLLACQALVLTTTRGSWLAGLAAALVWLWGQRRRRSMLLASLGLAAALGLMLLVTGWWQSGRATDYTVARRMQSFSNLKEESWTTRLYLWYSAWRLGNRRPVTGQGWGTFPYLALEFREKEPVRLRPLQRLPEDPHSQYFLWLAVGGYPSLLLWLASLAVFWRRSPSVGVTCAGTALAVNLLFLTCTLEAAVVWMLLFATAARRQPEVYRERERPAGAWVVPVVLATLAAGWWAGRALLCERELWWGDDYQLLAARSQPGWEEQVGRADSHYARAQELAGPGQDVVALERRGRLRMQVLQAGFRPAVAEEAAGAYATAAALAPLNPYPYASQARLYGFWSHTDPTRLALAERSWRQAVARDPRNPQFWAEWGLLYASHGRYSEALEKLEQSLAIAPLHGPYWLHKGEILLDLGRRTEAEPLLNEALRLDPALEAQVRAVRERTRAE